MKNRMLKLLAVVGALWSVTPKTVAAEDKENVKADVTVFANAEQVDDGHTFGELTLAPHANLEKGDWKLGYSGMFYNYRYSNGTYGDWMTFDSQLHLENADWKAQIGRMMLRPDFASYCAVPMTTTLGNDIKSAGSSRIFTGTRFTHKETGLGIGLVAHDTRMTPSHWDTGLVTWEYRFGKELGLAAHIGAGDKGFHNAGLTATYTPNDKTTLVAEGIYNAKTTHGILGAHHKLTDALGVFAGLKVDKPKQGKVSGWATLGLGYDLGHGFRAVGAVKQDIGGRHEVHGIIGLQYAGSFGIGGK